MGDYLITMDTGEKCIAHYGVKGQKWGVWNPETAARYNGVSLSTGVGPGPKDDDEKKELSNQDIKDLYDELKAGKLTDDEFDKKLMDNFESRYRNGEWSLDQYTMSVQNYMKTREGRSSDISKMVPDDVKDYVTTKEYKRMPSQEPSNEEFIRKDMKTPEEREFDRTHNELGFPLNEETQRKRDIREAANNKVSGALSKAKASMAGTQPSRSDFNQTMDRLRDYVVDRVVDEVRYRTSDLGKDKAVADYYRNAGDGLSDSERDALRQQAREQKKEETRKRRERARESGNPLWMFT